MAGTSALEFLIHQVAELKRQTSQMVRVGPVHEVDGDKVRMVLGRDEDGKEILSPWLNTSNHRGGSRERRKYTKGQNLALLCPNGDPSEGIIMPYAPNKSHQKPDHAKDEGEDDSETYQMEDLRVKKTKDGYDIWLEAPKQQQQDQQKSDSAFTDDAAASSGGDKPTGSAPASGGGGGGEVRMKLRINNDGGITGRVGKNRFMAHKEGVKLKYEEGGEKRWAVITKGKNITSHEWTIEKDPIPDDDK